MLLRQFSVYSVAAGIAVISGLCVASAAVADPTPKSGEFDQVESVTMPGLTQTSTSHVTFQGDRYRFQSVDIDDNYTPYDDIVDGQSYYHYIPAEHTAVRLLLKQKPESTLDSLRDQTQQKLDGMTKTGRTAVNGFDCDVYTRDLGSGSKVVLYRATDPKFPYIVKTVFTVPSESLTRSNSIENVKLNMVLGATEFILPTGTKIIERSVTQPGQSDGSDGGSNAPDGAGSGTSGAQSK
jgi:hypothetical protein